MSRIIAGSRRGRQFTTPPGSRTRPTTDRVREAVFSSLAAWAGTAHQPADEQLAGLAFCDLYAGSGAIGLEAASRGATAVTAVESDRRASRIIADNAAALGLTLSVQTTRAEEFSLRVPPGPADIIYADPPYEVSSTAVDRVVAQLIEQGWSAPDGLIICERSARDRGPAWPESPADAWSKHYGETVLHFWQR
jgi:16S rRNA (guanine966-N2)-methyltransferase